MGATLGTAGSLASLALFGLLPVNSSSLFAIDKIYRRDSARVRAWVARAIDMLGVRALETAADFERAPSPGLRLLMRQSQSGSVEHQNRDEQVFLADAYGKTVMKSKHISSAVRGPKVTADGLGLS